jgi:mannose/fructose/N-acetylgalactosamine-specific phosphotransferase system component IID
MTPTPPRPTEPPGLSVRSIAESAAPATPRLGARRLLALLFRAFFLQAAWNYERMQSIGFAAALAGEGRRLAPGERARPFLERHLGYVNTNPVVASGLLGGTVRLEEDVARGGDPAKVIRFKQVLAGPAAAWGDTLFWGTLRPVATAVGAVAALLGGWVGALVYLLGYNAIHLFYRSPAGGYARGADFARGFPIRRSDAAGRFARSACCRAHCRLSVPGTLARGRSGRAARPHGARPLPRKQT